MPGVRVSTVPDGVGGMAPSVSSAHVAPASVYAPPLSTVTAASPARVITGGVVSGCRPSLHASSLSSSAYTARHSSLGPAPCHLEPCLSGRALMSDVV